jgi:hypothetical protein
MFVIGIFIFSVILAVKTTYLFMLVHFLFSMLNAIQLYLCHRYYKSVLVNSNCDFNYALCFVNIA